MAVTMTGYGARSADGDSSLAEGKGPAWRRGEEFEACGVVLTGRIVGGEGDHVADSTVKVEERGVAVTVFWGMLCRRQGWLPARCRVSRVLRLVVARTAQY